MYNNILFNNKEKGVSLIITFFILTIILAVVLNISILFYGQIKIIRNIGNSVIAFYAADSGVEKILYYDRRQIPAGGLRGLCNIGNICPDCDPNLPGDCQEVNCQGWLPPIGNDCGSLTCGDCRISFNSFFDGKSYEAEITVTPQDGAFITIIGSKGGYKDVSRKIQLQIPPQ